MLQDVHTEAGLRGIGPGQRRMRKGKYAMRKAPAHGKLVTIAVDSTRHIHARIETAQARRKQALTTRPVSGAGRLASTSRPPLRCMMRLTMDMPRPAPLASLRALSRR